LAFLGSSLSSGQFQPFTEVLRASRREVTQKVGSPRIRLREGYGVTGYADADEGDGHRRNLLCAD